MCNLPRGWDTFIAVKAGQGRYLIRVINSRFPSLIPKQRRSDNSLIKPDSNVKKMGRLYVWNAYISTHSILVCACCLTHRWIQRSTGRWSITGVMRCHLIKMSSLVCLLSLHWGANVISICYYSRECPCMCAFSVFQDSLCSKRVIFASIIWQSF